MKYSVRTNQLKKISRFYNIMYILLLIGPIIGFLISGYINGNITVKRKFFATMTSLCSVIFAIMNALSEKVKTRTWLYLLMLAMSIVLPKMEVALIILVICNILLEYWIKPKRDKYNHLRIEGVEYDKRKQSEQDDIREKD